MPYETALERLRRLAGLPAATDATTVKPKPRIVPRVTALPEDPEVIARTQAEEDRVRGIQLRHERRDWPDAQQDTQLPAARRETFPRGNPLRAASDAASDAGRSMRPVYDGTGRTISSRDEFEPGSEADPDRLLGMSDRLERAAPYRPANEKAQLLSVGRRLGEESNILNRRPGKFTDAAMSAANMATLGAPEVAGLDRSESVEPEKARRQAANLGITPNELRETGAIGDDDLVPRTLTTDTPSTGRVLGNMAGGFAGIVAPLSAEKALVGRGLRAFGVRGTEGFNRVNRVAEGFEREQRYLSPRTGLGKLAKNATEFAVPGAIYDANSARANNEDVSDRVESGLAQNIIAGAALPAAFEGAGKVLHEAKPAMQRLREFAGVAKDAISDSRVPDRIELAPLTEPMPINDKPRAIDRLREFAAPHVADALSHPVGRAALTGAAALKDIDASPKARKAALTAAGVYAAGNMKGVNDDDPDGVIPAILIAAGVATHEGPGARDALLEALSKAEGRHGEIAARLKQINNDPAYQLWNRPSSKQTAEAVGLQQEFRKNEALVQTLQKHIAKLPVETKQFPFNKKTTALGAAAVAASAANNKNDDKSPLALGALAAGTLAMHGEGAGEMVRKLKPDNAPVFFSRVERHLEKSDFANSKPKTVAEWEKFFSKGGDYSPKEVKIRLGEQFENAREEGRSLTKKEVQEMLADNPVVVKATVIGKPIGHGEDVDVGGKSREGYENWANMDAGNFSGSSPTGRYEHLYTEPGGEDYREVVISAHPTKRYRVETDAAGIPRKWGVEPTESGKWAAMLPSGVVGVGPVPFKTFPTEAEAIKWAREQEIEYQNQERPNYSEKHYGHDNEGLENVIGQVRLKTRTDANGKKVLFIEEAQSQAGQDKAAKGYRDDPKIQELNDALNEEYRTMFTQKADLRSHVNSLTARVNDPQFAGDRKAIAAEKKKTIAQIEELEHRLRENSEQRSDLASVNLPPSSLPLVDDMSEYTNVLLRHVLDIAAREGHEKIAWTTGEMQSKRYASALRKKADRLTYNPETQVLKALDGGNVVLEKTTTPDRLADYVGKENAAKMLEAPRKAWKGELVHSLKGDDFTVGDSGMKNYYDRVLPDWFRKEANKLGVKIEIKDTALPDATRPRYADDAVIGSRTKPMSFESLPATEKFRDKGKLADFPEDVRSADAQLARDVWQAGKDMWQTADLHGGTFDAEQLNVVARNAMVDKLKEMSPDERQRLGRLMGEDFSDAAVYGDIAPHDLDAQGLEYMIALNAEPNSRAARAANIALKSMKRGDDFQTAIAKLSPEDRKHVARVVSSDLFSPSGDILRPGDAPIVQSFDVPPELPERIFAGQALYSNPMFDPRIITDLAKAHPTIFRGAALVGAGAATKRLGEDTDNERLKWSGMGIIGLGALHGLGAHAVNGKPLYKAASEFAGKKIVEGIKDEKLGSLKGRDLLNWISHDILATPELRAAADEYERGAAKAAARAAEYSAKMRRLGPIGERLASDLIDQEQWEKESSKLTPDEKKKVVAAAQALVNEFHDVGQQEVDLGTMGKGQFDKYDGQYIPRLYATHEADAAVGVGNGPTATNKPKIAQHKSRTDLPRQTRENMGQIRESGYLAQKGLEKGYRNIAAAKLFSALSLMPGVLHPDYQTAVHDLMEATKSGNEKQIRLAKQALDAVRGREKGGFGGYRTLSNAKGLGVMGGAVVRNDVADYLDGLPHFGSSSLANDLFQSWKKIHTVFNPGTHLGNFMSNIATVHMKGLPVHEVPGAIVAAGREIKQYGKYARALAEAGVTDNNLATMDYTGSMLPAARSKTEQLRELATRTTPVTKSVLSQREIEPYGKTSLFLKNQQHKAEKYYNLEDNWFRVALLQKVTKPVKAGGMGLNMEQGVEYVRHHMGDFRTRSRALAMARWYSPFVMYPAKMLPHMVGSIIEHPVRWLTLAGMWGVVDQLGAYATGTGPLSDVKQRIKSGEIDPMDMNEDERPSRGLGYIVPGPLQTPIKRKKAKFAFDVSRWTPFSALSGSPNPGSAAVAVSNRIPALLNPGGPLSDLFARTQVNKDPYSGEPWIDQAEAPGQKAWKIGMGLVGDQVLPSALSWHAPRFYKDVRDKNYQKAALDAMGFAGARPRTVLPGVRRKQDEYWKQDEEEAAKRALDKRKRETHDAARLRQAVEEYKERKARIRAEFKRRNTRPQ